LVDFVSKLPNLSGQAVFSRGLSFAFSHFVLSLVRRAGISARFSVLSFI